MPDNVWFVPWDGEQLLSPYTSHAGAAPVQAAQPFTVSLLSVVVAEDFEDFFRGKNDILVTSRASLGDQPLVERIHYYDEEIPTGESISNIFADTMFLTDDYNGEDKLYLELVVKEVDTDTGERQATLNALQSLVQSAGAVFPIVLPYAFAAAAVTEVLKKLITALERDQDVVKMRLSLYPGRPRPGRAVLQEGSFVVFASAQDPSAYRFGRDGLLAGATGAPSVSYAVFQVTAGKYPSPKFIVDQKVATLLTQMRKGNDTNALTAIHFLENTLTQYTNFSRLKRYLELQGKPSPSAEERALMQRIAADEALKPFLPKG
ncbi:MAG: hypothetical protein ACE147_11205 [Candidatus Methylomirabilales bacterium]